MEGGDAGVLVVGAGPAGLAVAAELRRRGVPVTLLERNAAVGSSWRGHYDRLRLHTVRWLSALPGLSIPRDEGAWVKRDGVVRYLERYAAHHGLDVHFGVEVRRLDRTAGRWRLETSGGPLTCAAVVVATGYNHTPHLPAWSGRDGFTGELVHSSDYRDAAPFRGRSVLVVGSGNSGSEIAVDLAEGGARPVWMAVRTPPSIIRKHAAGLPNPLLGVLVRPLPPAVVDPVARLLQRLSVGDLSRFGLPPPERGLYERLNEGSIPLIDAGIVEAVRKRSVEVVPALEAFDGAEVILRGGRRLRPGAVVAATGYVRGLEPLVGHLGLLGGAGGRPRVHGPLTDPAAPGLHFIGFTTPISGSLREIAIDARRTAAAIARELGRAAAPNEVHAS